MHTFFPLKKLRKLRCVLYMESFVLDSRLSLACKQIQEMCPYTIICFGIEKLNTEPIKKWRFQSNYPSSSDEHPMNKALNSLRNSKKSKQEYLKFGIGNVVAWGDEAPACLWHLWSSRDWKCKSSISKFSSNSSQIDLSSLTLSVPWVAEELDAVDSERYPWFYSGWPPKESIGRTDHFVAGASSDIIFWRDDPIVVFWVLPNHDVFTLFFRNDFLCFLLPFYFFSKCSPK